MSTLTLKAVLDRLVTIALLPLLIPVMALIALVIKIEHPGLPLFYADFAAGLNGRPFRFIKFRTMLPHPIDYDTRGEVFPGNPLVTPVGRWLRRCKLDELPQFLHVLRGQMSIVGPRPMDLRRYERASPFFRQRCLVTPGLTGIAQVSGNIHLAWEERMEMDIWYIQHWSLRLDFEVLVRTLRVIFFGEAVLDKLTTSRRQRDHAVRITRPGETA